MIEKNASDSNQTYICNVCVWVWVWVWVCWYVCQLNNNNQKKYNNHYY